MPQKFFYIHELFHPTTQLSDLSNIHPILSQFEPQVVM